MSFDDSFPFDPDDTGLPVTLIAETPTRLGKTHSVALTGLDGRIVTVEADIGGALPGFTLLGLPDKSLHEAKDRIRSAARNSQLPITRRHLTVNLTPAELNKGGPLFDLAIVMAAYGADMKITGESAPVFLAALGLDGTLHHAPGILPAVMAAADAGFTEVIVSDDSREEAELVEGIRVRSFGHLSQVLEAFGAPAVIGAPLTRIISEPNDPRVDPEPEKTLDLADVGGQAEARWALELAAAGGHNLLMQGPPGAGKTMLAERLPSILPPLDTPTSLEVTAIHSIADNHGVVQRKIETPPFVAPHHTASYSAIVGGGARSIQPGLVSLAHGGVLFLDEAPEFDRRVLEALRQPLEHGDITVTRSSGTLTFPAEFQLILAANPCPCGYAWGSGRGCTCTSSQRQRYRAKLSGPLLDRVDMQVNLSSVSSQELAHATSAHAAAESSATVRARVLDAVVRAEERLRPWGVRRNSQLTAAMCRHPELQPTPQARQRLDAALDAEDITARGYIRVLRLAWTITDSLGAERPDLDAIDMALHLRL